MLFVDICNCNILSLKSSGSNSNKLEAIGAYYVATSSYGVVVGVTSEFSAPIMISEHVHVPESRYQKRHLREKSRQSALPSATIHYFDWLSAIVKV